VLFWRQAEDNVVDRYFEIIVNEHRGTVFGLLFSLLRDRQLAEDITQETFLVLAGKIDTIDIARPILPWLLTTARNLAGNARRRCALEHKLFVKGDAAQGIWERLGSSDLGSDWDERLGVLGRCRKELSEPQKKVVDLYYTHGYSSQKIADMLGSAAAAVLNRLSRGRMALRRCIEKKLRGAL